MTEDDLPREGQVCMFCGEEGHSACGDDLEYLLDLLELSAVDGRSVG